MKHSHMRQLVTLAALIVIAAGAGFAQEESGPVPVVVREAGEAARLHPDDAAAQARFGEVCYEANLLRTALGAYRKAAALDSANVKTLTNLGIVLRDLGRPDTALVVLGHARRLAPDDAVIITNEALAYYDLGETERAVEGFSRTLELDPNNQFAHFQLGVAFAEAGMIREAVREWETVVAIDSTSVAGQQAADNIEKARDLLGR